jgi:D-alanyl-D-alanine dipeptidase
MLHAHSRDSRWRAGEPRAVDRGHDRCGLHQLPTEWWHWSYGDRYWAFAAHRPAAIYGPIEA